MPGYESLTVASVENSYAHRLRKTSELSAVFARQRLCAVGPTDHGYDIDGCTYG